jgi:hypothetical protein
LEVEFKLRQFKTSHEAHTVLEVAAPELFKYFQVRAGAALSWRCGSDFVHSRVDVNDVVFN